MLDSTFTPPRSLTTRPLRLWTPRLGRGFLLILLCISVFWPLPGWTRAHPPWAHTSTHTSRLLPQQRSPAKKKTEQRPPYRNQKPHYSFSTKRMDARLQQALFQLLRSGKKGPATFDGDGTLWAGDTGEGFFAWMLENKHFPAARLPRLHNAWLAYRAGRFDGEKMYELMVTGMAGMKESEVKELASRYFDQHHKQLIYRPMYSLVHTFDQAGFKPWVVSGSPYWVVAAGAKHLGIPPERVIGLSVEVDAQGRLTKKVVRPVPWKRGKAARIMQQVGRAPLFAAGNSDGDVQMLRIASELPLLINPTPSLLKDIQGDGWLIQQLTRADTFSRPMHAPARAD